MAVVVVGHQILDMVFPFRCKQALVHNFAQVVWAGSFVLAHYKLLQVHYKLVLVHCKLLLVQCKLLLVHYMQTLVHKMVRVGSFVVVRALVEIGEPDLVVH